MNTTETLSARLILGTAFNYSNADIFPFLNSLELTGYNNDLILLTNNQSSLDLSNYSFKGKTINLDDEFSTTPVHNDEQLLLKNAVILLEQKKQLEKEMVAFFYRSYFLMTSRYFLYYYYLNQFDHEQVFLTDVNDVIFQHDPFKRIYNNGVTAFAEHHSISIKNELTNRSWIAQSFGNTVLKAVGEKVVYCAGTIMINRCIRQFLSEFLKIIIIHNISRVIEGVDQAVLNYMISYLQSDYIFCKTNGEIVLTVANVPPNEICLTKEGLKLKGFDELPAVIHQYTRFEIQRSYVRDKYQSLQNCSGND